MLLLPEIEKLTDKELIERYKSTSDISLPGFLYQRYTSFVFAVSMKYLKNEDRSKDAVMDIFEKLIDDLLRFDIENFKPWLHQVTRNHCLLELRSQGYQRKYSERYKKDSEVFMESTHEMYHDNEDSKEQDLNHLELALDELKDEQKECIRLFYLEEKCYTEVSEITGFSMKQVKSYIQNGKRNLKNILEENKRVKKDIGTFIFLFILICMI